MFKDLTLGQYYPVDSFVHRLDPRAKLLSTLLYLISLFVTGRLLGYAAAILYMGSLIALSRISLKYMFRGLKGILFLLLFSVLLNMFLTPGRVVASFWFVRITEEGLIQAGKMALRLVLLLLGSSLLTFTTTPTGLTDGLEQGLSFLKIIKIPVHEIAMMMSIALRFLPVLTEELAHCFRLPTGRGIGHRYGGPLLSRGRGQNQDETFKVSAEGLFLRGGDDFVLCFDVCAVKCVLPEVSDI